MAKVKLTDGRVKEFSTKAKAEAYAKATRGTVVKSTVKEEVKAVTKKKTIRQYRDKK